MKKLFVFISAVLLALIGCTEEDVVKQSLSIGKIQASFEDEISSRLAVGEGNALSWSTGDAFTMFRVSGQHADWTLEGEGGATIGVFVGLEPEGTTNLVGAAFPASASPNFNNYELTMTLPAELDYQPGICNLPMWAWVYSLDDKISFKHLGAMLKIDFKDIPEGFNQMIVTADKPIAGTFSTDFSQQDVLSYKENGSNSVIIKNFATNSDEDNDRMFYLPLPVGVYNSLNVSISDGTNTISIANWKNRIIERKKVYFASLTYRVLEAAGNETLTPTLISAALSEIVDVTPNATVDIAGEIKAEDVAITIPTEAKKVTLNFVEIPNTEAAPLKIVQENTDDTNQLTISLPTSNEAKTEVDIETPTTTVNIEGGNYAKIVAHTAANTLVLGKGTTVKDIVVKGGNVALRGGTMAENGSIIRAEGVDETIRVSVIELDGLSTIQLGDGVELVEPDYVTFSAEAEQTLCLVQKIMGSGQKEVEGLEYSVNGGDWKELGTSTVTFGGTNGDLRLRNKNLDGTGFAFDDCATVEFGNENVPVACTGDIRTLVDYENYNSDELDTSNARFIALFYNCKNLISAPKLPATDLADYCYRSMFNGCESLTKAPELPASNLAYGCYYEMFQACKSLTEAPVLSATTLVSSCYRFMFSYCSGLTEAPELPATNLANDCYHGMFSGCSGLTEAPELPATTLAYNCYQGMFSQCTALTEAPVLPATTLVDQCYTMMFYGCMSLTKAPELPATTLTLACYQNMFNSCTKLIQAPELPASKLARGCYSGMFAGCIGLAEAPELLATVLANNCYSGMFQGCKNLTKVIMLATDISAPSCLDYWLSGAASNGTIFINGDLEDTSALNVPNGWTSEIFTFNTTWTSATVASNYVLGTGTLDDPYLIRSAEDLEWAKQTREGYMRLETDLTIESYENAPWTPIGEDAGSAFYGIFDGNGKTIRGTLCQGSQDLSNFGLFGYGSYATIKNLNVDAEVLATTAVNVGGIAGNWIGFDNKMSNCTFKGTVEAGVAGLWNYKRTGGLVGYGTAQMDNCINYGQVKGVQTDASGKLTESYTGGIVGKLGTINGSTLNNCDNMGTVTGGVATEKSYTGGIAGHCQSTLKGCDNSGTIQSGKGDGAVYTGGLVGFNEGGIVCTCCTDTSNASIGGGTEGHTSQTSVEGCTHN